MGNPHHEDVTKWPPFDVKIGCSIKLWKKDRDWVKELGDGSFQKGFHRILKYAKEQQALGNRVVRRKYDKEIF